MPGPAGPQGPKGDPAELNYQALVNMLRDELPRAVERVELRDGKLVQVFTDNTESTIGDLGFTFEMFNDRGAKVDSQFVPNAGTLKLQTFVTERK